MQERLNKLLTVKSIVTILLTILFCILALKEGTIPQAVLTIYTMIIGFYFGTQAKKE